MNSQNSGNAQTKKSDVLTIVGEVVSSYVSNNNVQTDEMTNLIKDVYETFANLGNEVSPQVKPEPMVPIEESITPDYVICLEDGKKLKMLKRHLKTVYNMTPDDYRQKWGLGADYPMVAPNYAEKRSKLAKHIRLGKRGRADKIIA